MKTANVMELAGGAGNYAVSVGKKGISKNAEDTAAVFNSMMNQFESTNFRAQTNSSAGTSDSSSDAGRTDSEDYNSPSSYRAGNVHISSEERKTIAETADEAEEQLDMFEDTVVSAVSEQLGVPEEEVVRVMKEMGIHILDLLDSGNLGQLVMQLTGMENRAQLLVNTDFQDLMDQVEQLGVGLMEELDLDMDQLKDLGHYMETLPGNMASEGMEASPDVPVNLETPVRNDGNPSEVVPTEDGKSQIVVNPISDENAQLSPAEMTESGIAAPTDSGQVQSDEFVQADGQVQSKEILQTDGQQADEPIVLTVKAEEMPAAEEHQASVGNPAASEQQNPADTSPADTGTVGETDEPEIVQTVSEAQTEGQSDSQTDDSYKDESFQADTQQWAGKTQQDRADISLNFVNMNPEAAVNEPVLDSPQSENSYVSFHTTEFISQVVEHVRTAVQNQVTSLEMQLNPEHLGKMLVTLTSREGAVTAQFMAANESVRAALEAQVTTLSENLNQAGVKVDAIEVMVGTHEFEQNLEQNARGEQEQAQQQENGNQNSGRRNISLNSLDDLSGILSEEERLVAQIMQDHGNSMDLTV